jgi:hypothetical protein
MSQVEHAPGPVSPRPVAYGGPRNRTPRASSNARLACTARLAHVTVHGRGQRDRRERREAHGGEQTRRDRRRVCQNARWRAPPITSAQRANSMWPIAASARVPEIVANAPTGYRLEIDGPTNSRAPRADLTSQPRSTSRRTSSTLVNRYPARNSSRIRGGLFVRSPPYASLRGRSASRCDATCHWLIGLFLCSWGYGPARSRAARHALNDRGNVGVTIRGWPRSNGRGNDCCRRDRSPYRTASCWPYCLAQARAAKRRRARARPARPV